MMTKGLNECCLDKIEFDGIHYYMLETIQAADEEHHEMPWARCAQDIADDKGRYQCVVLLFDRNSKPAICREALWKYNPEENDFESLEW